MYEQLQLTNETIEEEEMPASSSRGDIFDTIDLVKIIKGEKTN